MSYETILVDRVVTDTDAAVLLRIQGENYWVPKSVIDGGAADVAPGDEGIEVNIASWFVRKEDLPTG